MPMSRFRQTGYVLLLTLVFMQLFACLGLYSLLSMAVELKTSRHRILRELVGAKARDMVRAIEADVMRGGMDCVFPLEPSSFIKMKPTEWWQQHACLSDVGKYKFYYRVEALGVDPCGLIYADSNKIVASEYYRVTVNFLPTEEGEKIKLFLQTVLAKPASQPLSCVDQQHSVTPGRQMIREG
jgi:hypothetical protein